MGDYKTGDEIPTKIRELLEDSMEQELEGIIKLEKSEAGNYRYLCNFVGGVKVAEIEPLPLDNLVKVRYSSVFEGADV